MLILAIDTSTRAGSVAVLRNREVLAEVSGLQDTPYSTRLFRDVAALQSRAEFTLKQVDLFAVAAGPGSFTGLRVGLTAVKGWAEVHGKPIAAISGLEAIASESVSRRAFRSSRQRNGVDNRRETPAADFPDHDLIAPFLDARKGYVFGAVYRPAHEGVTFELASEESILPVQEFLELVSQRSKGGVILVSPTPGAISIDEARNILPNVRIEQVPAALAVAIGRLGYARAQSGQLVDAVRLDANYVRRSDAEAAGNGG